MSALKVARMRPQQATATTPSARGHHSEYHAKTFAGGFPLVDALRLSSAILGNARLTEQFPFHTTVIRPAAVAIVGRVEHGGVPEEGQPPPLLDVVVRLSRHKLALCDTIGCAGVSRLNAWLSRWLHAESSRLAAGEDDRGHSIPSSQLPLFLPWRRAAVTIEDASLGGVANNVVLDAAVASRRHKALDPRLVPTINGRALSRRRATSRDVTGSRIDVKGRFETTRRELRSVWEELCLFLRRQHDDAPMPHRLSTAAYELVIEPQTPTDGSSGASDGLMLTLSLAPCHGSDAIEILARAPRCDPAALSGAAAEGITRSPVDETAKKGPERSVSTPTIVDVALSKWGLSHDAVLDHLSFALRHIIARRLLQEVEAAAASAIERPGVSDQPPPNAAWSRRSAKMGLVDHLPATTMENKWQPNRDGGRYQMESAVAVVPPSGGNTLRITPARANRIVAVDSTVTISYSSILDSNAVSHQRLRLAGKYLLPADVSTLADILRHPTDAKGADSSSTGSSYDASSLPNDLSHPSQATPLLLESSQLHWGSGTLPPPPQAQSSQSGAAGTNNNNHLPPSPQLSDAEVRFWREHRYAIMLLPDAPPWSGGEEEGGALSPADIWGFSYTLRLRYVLAAESSAVVDAWKSICQYGFLNYFGRERFDASTLKNVHIGLFFLKGEFRAAVHAILGLTADHYRSRTRVAAAAGARSGDDVGSDTNYDFRDVASGRLDALVRTRGGGKWLLLAQLLRTSIDGGTSEATCRAATMGALGIGGVRRFVQQFLAFVWNSVLSQRIKRHGCHAVLEGDIVRPRESVTLRRQTRGTAHDDNADDSPISKPPTIDTDQIVKADRSRTICGMATPSDDGAGQRGDDDDDDSDEWHQPVFVTAEDVRTGRYGIEDVVLPIPGMAVQLPRNDTARLYNDTLHHYGLRVHPVEGRWLAFEPDHRWMEDALGARSDIIHREGRAEGGGGGSGGGLGLYDVNEFGNPCGLLLPGGYRFVVEKPVPGHHRLVLDKDPSERTEPIRRAWKTLRGQRRPEWLRPVDLVATIHCLLPSSSYPSCLLRELTKNDFCSAHQLKLHRYTTETKDAAAAISPGCLQEGDGDVTNVDARQLEEWRRRRRDEKARLEGIYFRKYGRRQRVRDSQQITLARVEASVLKAAGPRGSLLPSMRSLDSVT